jgi:hypothetical protein
MVSRQPIHHDRAVEPMTQAAYDDTVAKAAPA